MKHLRFYYSMPRHSGEYPKYYCYIPTKEVYLLILAIDDKDNYHSSFLSFI